MKLSTIGASLAASLAGLCLAKLVSLTTNWKLATDAGDAEIGGCSASQALATSATENQLANGVKIGRMNEKFSCVCFRSIGNEANTIFVPHGI